MKNERENGWLPTWTRAWSNADYYTV